MTVSDLLTFYVETAVASADLAPKTLDGYAWAIQTHLIPALGSTRITTLTAEDVERFLVHRRDDHELARSSLRTSSFQRSLKWSWGASNPDFLQQTIARISAPPDRQ